MKNEMKHPFGSTLEAILYPLMLLIVLWIFYWAYFVFPEFEFHKLGVLPHSYKGLIGVIFMPLIHSKNEMAHIINNSFPIAVLLSYLIYFYRDVALKVFLTSWLLTGLLVWIVANNKGGYHIGISGMIYALAGFIFVSGVIKKYLPLQAISLFVAFYYGSMIWGILPMDEKISWEGHLMGLLVGIGLAFYYRHQGPVRPKYQFEVEKDMGIEPPDLEGIYWEKVRIHEQQLLEKEQAKLMVEKEAVSVNSSLPQIKIVYHYQKPNPPLGETPEQ